LAGVKWFVILVYGEVLAGFQYDAIWHTIFVGFVFSMVFGHAPIIFPAILQVRINYHKGYYIPLILLHLSLLLRLIGDVVAEVSLRKWGGMINGITIVLFFVTVISSLRKQESL
jgi:hypothetical protein